MTMNDQLRIERDLELADEETAKAASRDDEIARQNDLWDAGAKARYQDELRRMVRNDAAAYDRELDDAAILTVDGHFAGQASLADECQMISLRVYAKNMRTEGKVVECRKGQWVDTARIPCPCGSGFVTFRSSSNGWGADTCSRCGRRVSSCNTLTGIVYAWSTEAERDAADEWYDSQEDACFADEGW